MKTSRAANSILKFILTACIISNFAACEKKQKGTHPDVLILLVDTLRADHLPSYGYPPNTAPFLTEWAKDAMIFEKTFAQSTWTKSSVASLFTSNYVSIHGVFTSPTMDNPKRSFTEDDVLTPHAITLAEVFQNNGYQTAAFSTNYHVVPIDGFGQGFDYFNIVDIEWMTKKAGDKVNEHFLEWASKRNRKKPFFAYLHYMDVHGPYLPPEKYKNAFMEYHQKNGPRMLTDAEYSKLQYMKLEERDLNKYIALYDAQILYWDDLFADLIKKLPDYVDNKNLIVVVVGDHGEQFMEHGCLDHGCSVNVEESWVPLFVKYEGTVTPGKIGGRAALIDVAPTILKLSGIKPPKQFKGLDLLANDFAKRADRSILTEIRLSGRADFIGLMEGDRKWVFSIPFRQAIAVYDIKSDPAERKNILRSVEKYEIEKKNEWLVDWLKESEKKRIPKAKVKPGTKMDPKNVETLRGLGYLQ